MVHHAPHDPPHFAPHASPGRRLALIRTAAAAVPLQVTTVGSSSAKLNSTFSTAVNTYKHNAEGYLAWMVRLAKQRFGYIRDMRSTQEYHFGFAGLTTRQLIDNGHAAACAAATAACGGVAYLQLLQNDIGAEVSAATCLARVEEFCDIFEAAGANYIICEPFRRLASETNAAAKLAIYEAVIAGLPAIATARGVGLALWSTLGEDGSTGYIRTDHVNSGGDPGHPLPPLAYKMGAECWRVHQLFFPVPDPPDLSALIVHPTNILPNSILDTPGAGSSPTGWTVNNLGTATHVKGNKIAYGDGSGAFKFPITVNEPVPATSTAAARLTCSSDIFPASGWAIGDIAEAVYEVFTPNASGWKCGAISNEIILAPPFWTPGDGGTSYTPATPPTAIERPTDSIVFRSMPLAIPGTTTQINFRGIFLGSGYEEIGKPSLLINHGNAILPPHFEYP
jgi:hypothetical protein